jgi:hypothetical protein
MVSNELFLMVVERLVEQAMPLLPTLQTGDNVLLTCDLLASVEVEELCEGWRDEMNNYFKDIFPRSDYYCRYGHGCGYKQDELLTVGIWIERK